MSWMLTASGVAFSLSRPHVPDINLGDVAYHLAGINRFCGAAKRRYSVAEHSLLVAEICERDLGMTDPVGLLAALMHDAHEAYMGDINTMVKLLLGEQLQVLEWSLELAVQQRYGLRTASRAYHDAIKRADRMALATEKRDLMPPSPAPWAVLTGIEPITWIDLREREGMDDDDWCRAFKARFNELNYARALRMGKDPESADNFTA
jgi:hypothetical protein